LESHPIEAGPLLEGEEPDRPVRGTAGVVRRLSRVAARRRNEEVVGKLREVRLGVAPMERLERSADSTVELDAPSGGQLVVENVPDQHVREAQLPYRAWDLRDDPRRHGLVERRQELLLRELANARERVERKLAPEYRGERECSAAGFRKVAQAPADDIAQPLWNREPLGGAHKRRLEPTLGGQQPHQLAEEEWVSRALLVNRTNEVVGCPQACGELDVPCHGRPAYPAQLEEARGPVAGKLRRGLRQWVLGPHLGVPVGADHEDGALRQLAGYEAQKEKGRRVGGVEIVEDEHERLRLRRVPQEGGRRVEESEAGALRFGDPWLREVGEEVTELRQHLGDVDRTCRQVGSQGVRFALAQVAAQGLHPGPVGGRTANLPAAAPKDLRASLPRLRRQLVREPALSNAGFAAEHEEVAASGERFLQSGTQLLRLAVATNQGPAGDWLSCGGRRGNRGDLRCRCVAA
jgi:hypothetical protein